MLDAAAKNRLLATYTTEMTTPASTSLDRLLAMSRDTSRDNAPSEGHEATVSRTSPSAQAPAPSDARDAWRRASRRHRAALQGLVREHGPRLRRYLLGMLGPAAPVDDLVQDAFITALGNLDGLREDAVPSTWLHGIARNLARNWRRKEDQRARLMLQTPQAEANMRGRAPEDPERQHDHRRSLSRMQVALAELPETEHEAFVLRHLGGHSLTEVASLQTVAVSTASARVKRAEQALRRAMKGAHG